MPSSYTTSLRLTLPATGELSGTWGTTVNTGITELTDAAIAGYVSIAMTDADYTLTVANGSADQARRMMLNMTGTLTAARNVICPTASKLYIIKNATTGGFAITLKTSAGTGISIPNGSSMLLMCNGTDVVDAVTQFSSGAFTNLSYTGTLTGGTGVVALGTNQFYKDASGNIGLGTASPGQKLTVAGGAVLIDNAQYYYGKNAAGSAVRLLGINAGNVNYVGAIDSGPTEVNYGAATTITAQYWNISGSENMRLTSTGLGIGTASPGAKLDVNGSAIVGGSVTTTANVSGLVTLGRFNAGYPWSLIRPSSDSSGFEFRSFAGTQWATLDSSGNLGLGVTPSAWGSNYKAFESAGNAAAVIAGANVNGVTVSSNTYNDNTNWLYKTTGAAARYSVNTGIHQFFTAPSGTAGNTITFTQAMTLDASGNLGIGTASPSGKLVVSNAGANGFEFDPTNGTMQTYNRSGSAYTGTKIYGLTFDVRTGASPAANTFFIDASGNVGIGTASPAVKLDVSVGTNTIAQQWQGAGTNFTLRLKSGTGSTQSSSVYRLYMDYLSGTNTNGYIDFYRGTGGDDGYLVFGTNGSDRMTLNAAGNLGLGVTPSAWSGFKAIQVGNGSFGDTVGASNNALFGSNTYFNGAAFTYINTTTATLYRQLSGQHQFYTAPSGTAGNAISFTQAMTLDASGRLGIGTASPARPLDVLGTANGVAIFKNSTAAAFAEVSVDSNDRSFAIGQRSSTNASGDLAYLYSGTATPIAFFTNTQERVRITSGGVLLLGITGTIGSANDRLQVDTSTAGARASVFRNSTSNTDTIAVWNAATTGDNKFVQFYTEAGASVRGSIDYNRAGGLVVYNTTSDYRAKDILGPVQNPGATIDALKVYEGLMKGATQSRPMLVAHEAQEHAPYAVSGEKDEVNEDGTPKFQQIDVSSLVPLLLAEIQSLRARVASLETQP
tara:strand:+ start:7741 stop:10587 length:2847 start_codon:yes stop_codon:yes gene_type:complete